MYTTRRRARAKGLATLLALCASFNANAECMLGELTTFAGNFVPRGYAVADGRLLSIAQNPSLFSIIGTRFGGDGRTTFALPNISNGLAHQPGSDASSTTPVPLQTLICVAGTFPARS